MGKTLQKENQVIAVTDIVRHGEKLILPENMTLKQGIDLLERRAEYEKEVTAFSESYDVLPFDGAHALAEVLIAKFGWAPATSTPSFFGDQPPQLISIETAPGVFVQVPWGRFSLPNVRGYIETGVSRKEGRYVFSINAQILRMNEDTVRSLFAEVREYLKTGSIYKGKAIQMRFRDDSGEPLSMPQPKFIDTSKIDPKALIYAQEVMDSVETNLFVPVSRAQDCLDNGIPVKRGVLLAGTYGTGKTMAAFVASRLATDAGITYVYAKRADELADAIEFGKQYQSPACVVFCEDIDRSVNGERSVEMDDILNILDGIDTKHANIITVLTTNDLESINPAMLRPGRLDAVINVTPPDALAVEKLIRHYGSTAIAADTDLTEAGKELAGNIPAVIAEVVKRAKLSQLRLQAPGEKVNMISSEALTEAAKTMRAQVTLLRERSEAEAKPVTVDDLLRDIVSGGSDVTRQFAAKVGIKVK
jgi:transitional endoplasmic reticulum ATPase